MLHQLNRALWCADRCRGVCLLGHGGIPLSVSIGPPGTAPGGNACLGRSGQHKIMTSAFCRWFVVLLHGYERAGSLKGAFPIVFIGGNRRPA